ncbi:hypothetical protein CRYUN_Cryun36dG0033900 [Craigia yunnanensis]
MLEHLLVQGHHRCQQQGSSWIQDKVFESHQFQGGQVGFGAGQITLGAGNDQDFYDVSIVDGYNLPLVAAPRGVYGACNATSCAYDLNMGCPKELQVVGGDGGGPGRVVACKSACEAFGLDQFCCSGEFAIPTTCRPSFYSTIFKWACPWAYSYAYDDGTSTFTCKASDYLIIFCPNSQRSNGGFTPPFNDDGAKGKWVVSSMDDKLHYPKELFHDCDPVRSILGAFAPYAVPKVRSGKLIKDIGFKTEVTLDDVLKVLKLWRSETPFKASIAQMSRLYTFIWNEIHNSRQNIAEEFHAASSIFVPYKSASRPVDVVSGIFWSSKEVYWHDSTGTMDQRKRFKHLDNIDFLYFGTLNDNEKELLQTKLSIPIRAFGIPVLSEVVTREAIYDGRADGRFKASLVNWALPFAQRYLYSVHPDNYIQLKQYGFGNINHLQIVVVDKLYYRNVIKSCGIVSKKQFECTCLLQDNILYATPESDSHALYMEFSRLLFDGTPDLHLENFLHMVTTMAKSGSNEEQSEFFILNSQKVPKLPDEEPVWTISSAPHEAQNNEFPETSSATTAENEQSTTKSQKKTGIYSNWPPVDWKTAPGLSNRQAPISQHNEGSEKHTYNGTEHTDSHTSSVVPVEMNTNMSMETIWQQPQQF